MLRRFLGLLVAALLLAPVPASAALEFTAGSTDQLTFEDQASFDGVGSVTFMFWHYHVGSANLTNGVGDHLKNTNLLFYHSSSSSPNGIAIGVNGVWECRSSSANLLPPNTWTHVAFTWDGTVWSMFINGAPITTAGVCNAALNDQGAQNVLWQDNTGASYRLAAYKSWAAALSPAEVAVEAFVIRPQRLDNLLYWYPFDDERRALSYAGSGARQPTTVTGTTQVGSPPASWDGG